MAGRGRKPTFSRGDSRFADETLALVKVRFLFADMNNDLCRSGHILAMPPTHFSGAWKGPSGKVSQPQTIMASRPAPAMRTKERGFMEAHINYVWFGRFNFNYSGESCKGLFGHFAVLPFPFAVGVFSHSLFVIQDFGTP